jgi:hypothetical protein
VPFRRKAFGSHEPSLRLAHARARGARHDLGLNALQAHVILLLSALYADLPSLHLCLIYQ